jgi:hypothetical protein
MGLGIVRRPKSAPIHELETLHALQGLLAGAGLSVQA